MIEYCAGHIPHGSECLLLLLINKKRMNRKVRDHPCVPRGAFRDFYEGNFAGSRWGFSEDLGVNSKLGNGRRPGSTAARGLFGHVSDATDNYRFRFIPLYVFAHPTVIAYDNKALSL